MNNSFIKKSKLNKRQKMTSDWARLKELDKRHLWHPYTQHKDFEEGSMLCIDHADGVFLYDENGKAYYDTISSWWCIVHGHNRPEIKQAIAQQMDRLEQVHFAGTTHAPGIRLAQRLVELTPEHLTRVFFSDNGSTACEIAVKMSFQYWKQVGQPQRQGIISLKRGYHGDTLGTMSLGGTPQFHSAFAPLLFSTYKLPSPYCYRCEYHKEPISCDFACLKPLEDLLNDKAQEMACIILEPLLQAAGGMIAYSSGYLRRLERLIKQAGIHLIFDEVATGFGRTGRMFALEHVNAKPDFLCLSKGLTAGWLPMAATLTTEEVFCAFYDDYSKGKTFFHGHTFTGNPLAASAALASLNIFEKDRVLENLGPKMELLQNGAKEFLRHPFIGDVRGMGMVAAFELVQDKATKTPFAPESRMGFRIYLEGLKYGLILRPLGDVLYLFLPLSTTSDEIKDILQRMERLLWEFFRR
jgi:adenosylmethionine-8-amino-7-oxononanoate aminotransferase